MLLSRALTIVIASLQFHRTHQGSSNYVIHVTDEAADCPGKKHESISNYFDPTHLEVDWTDNGYIILNGYTYLTQAVSPDQKIQLKVQVLKKLQGKWVESLFGIQRNDGCPHLMDPKEPWYALFDQLEGDQQKCPPKKGLKYEFHNKTIEMYITAPSEEVEGEYKLVLNFHFKEGHMCTCLFALVKKLRN